MTDQETNRKTQSSDPGRASLRYAPQSGASATRSSSAAIAAGLDYLLQHVAEWDCSGKADAWMGCCVLARLGELPEHSISSLLREKVEAALGNLLRMRAACGHNDTDAEFLGRTIIALRAGGQAPPEDLLHALWRCRQTDGGFALFPQDWSGSAPEITVTAVHALRTMDRPAEDFLAGCMQRGESQLSSWLSVCAGILDWEKGLAPLPLLNQACRLIVRVRPQSAFEHALLLRCLVRLRLQQAWISAAELRGMQMENGSWPGPAPRRPAARELSFNPDQQNVIATVTAVSALALCESQPGLYFGSDLPRPRRLYES
ncbi:MAG TPA: hypothetical protein VKW06_22630 [Candidatus Angelobacter sp.]|nr:hypothetical protein [Candidatus Angelobacter sp.]